MTAPPSSPDEPASGPRRIVLVGFMGCGKTSVGRELVRLLGWSFRDMDSWIEARLGRSIREIFDERGEAFFRGEEQTVAELTSELDRFVVAAGGGAFAEARTRRALSSGALTVWLSCSWETVVSRVGSDGIRPKATDRARMRELFVERLASYRRADVTVDVTDLSITEAARQIAAEVLSAQGGGAPAVE